VLPGGVSLAHVIDNPLVAPRNVGRYLTKIAVVFAAQFAAGKLGDVLQTINSGGIGPVWPAAGVALGAILLFGYSVWPGVAAGAFLLASLSPLPLWAAFAYAAGTTLAALIAAFLLRHIADFRPSLSRLRDVLGLILFGALGSAIVSASIGTSILYAARVRGWSGFGPAWLIYLLGDIMGVLLVTPVLLTFTDLLRIRPFSRIAELVAGQSLLVVVCFIIFGDLPLISVKLHILAFAVLPFVVGAAIRFGVSGVSLATLLISLIATIETALGSGPFASNNHFLNAVLLDVFFGVFSTLGLTLAAVIAEKEQSARERERFEREQAATEARLRFAAIVESCDDAIISGTLDGIIVSWNGGAQRIYEYTEAEAVGKPIAILLPPELPHEENKILETLRAGGRIEHFETIRITKTGKRINVSLTISPIRDSGGRTVGISGIGRDITGRKLAEQAHQEIEDKLRLLLDSTAEAIYGVDLEHRCTFCNSACLRISGYEHSDQLLGKNTHDLLHHTRADGTALPVEECRVHRVARTGEGVHSEDEVFWRANGTSFPVEYWSYPQRRGDEVVGAVVAFTDITERKLAEERLRESEEQFRTLAEAIPQLCWMAHGDGHIFWYNQRWYTYTGTTPEQMEGWGWQSVHDPQALPLVLERWKTSIATGEPFDMVFPLKAANGEFHPFLTRITPVKDSKGSVVGWFGTNTDVTELRDAQEALRTSEERLRLALQAARIGTFEWNLRTGVNTWTPELESLYGLPPGGFGGTRTAFENLVHPEDRARIRELVDMALKSGPPTRGEWRVVFPDGSVHWIAGRWQVFMNESGEPSRMIGINTDITDQKLAEESLSGMTRKLVEAQEQERARIARELHDDINQRLAMLAIELEQLKENPSDIGSRLQELRQRTSEISNDVQALSHDLHSSQLEYLGVVAGMKSWCKEFARRQKMEIDCRHDVRSTLQPEIGLCLFRVLQEALHNAVKHSGVNRIEVQLREQSGEIHLIVSDSGRGFDMEAIKQGRGLGLISMRERVRLVNGTIEIESKQLGGTTIHVRVPFESEHSFQRAAG